MSTDWYTKLVLTVLAVCAALLVARGFGFERGADTSAPSEAGRYSLQFLPMARMILKVDSETGKTWKTTFPEPKVWLPIADEPLETLDDAAPAGSEPPEPEAEAEAEAADSVVPAPAAPPPANPGAP